MRKKIFTYGFFICFAIQAIAQVEPTAGTWKTWFIESGKAYRPSPPPSGKEEIKLVLSAQRDLDPGSMENMMYWNAGSPGYRWYALFSKLWMNDISGNGALTNMLIGTAIYDATVAAWDAKYYYNRVRPYLADGKVNVYAPKPESPSYPCEYSVAAGVAVTLIKHFYPAMADSANRLAERVMTSRVAAGVAYPSDTRAGFDLGKRIAEKEIDQTKDFITKKEWDGKVPDTPGLWSGKFALLPMAGHNKTVVLKSSNEFRPVPPPDWSKEMEELKNFKQTFSSRANAFHYASQDTGGDLLTKKIFEYNLHTNAPRAARVYAAVNVAYYDAFTACWDAKYYYWGIRPGQYDPTYKPLMQDPPFPGYPSGHAMMCGVIEELFPYFFPADRNLFKKYAYDGAESRFHAGIHFRSDNDAGLELGRKVAAKVIEQVSKDGAGNDAKVANLRKPGMTNIKEKP